MKMNHIFFFISIVCVAPFACAMEEYQEIVKSLGLVEDERPSRVPNLRQLAMTVIQDNQVKFFQTPVKAGKLCAMPEPEMNDQLVDKSLFASAGEDRKFQHYVQWFLAECPIEESDVHIVANQVFLAPRHETQTMQIQANVSPVKVVAKNSNEVLFECPLVVREATFSGDGKYCYIIDTDKYINIYDAHTWELKHKVKLTAPVGMNSFLYIHPEGTNLLYGTMRSLKLVSMLTGEPIRELVKQFDDGFFRTVKVSADGNKVYVYSSDAEQGNPNDGANMNASVASKVRAYDISRYNQVSKQLFDLTHPQLLVLQLVHQIAHGQEGLEQWNKDHVQKQYQAMPLMIKSLVRRIIRNKGKAKEQESAFKRRKLEESSDGEDFGSTGFSDLEDDVPRGALNEYGKRVPGL